MLNGLSSELRSLLSPEKTAPAEADTPSVSWKFSIVPARPYGDVMSLFLIAADPSAADALKNAALRRGGKPLNRCCWAIVSDSQPDPLATAVRREVGQRVVVCRLDDWSYR
jgi:hypothetical protein